MCKKGGANLCQDLAPVDSWLVKTSNIIGFIKGCFQPLPGYFFVPRVVSGRKIWTLEEPVSLYGIRFIRHECIGRRSSYIVYPGSASFISPIDSAKRLRRECRSALCSAALELLEYISSVTDLVGVTGGLAYNPLGANDIDIVVYGSRIETVYNVLRDLRYDGVTSPFTGRGHGWSNYDYTLNSVIARLRYLLGYYKGYEYNVRLIYCTRPARCTPIQVLGRIMLEAEVVSALGFSTPSLYVLRPRRIHTENRAILNKITKARSLQMITYRLRYAEIPVKTIITVKGELESHEGVLRVIPDHGGNIRITKINDYNKDM